MSVRPVFGRGQGSRVWSTGLRSWVCGRRSFGRGSRSVRVTRPPLRDGQKIEREAHETRARKHARARRAFWCVLGSCHDPRGATGCFPGRRPSLALCDPEDCYATVPNQASGRRLAASDFTRRKSGVPPRRCFGQSGSVRGSGRCDFWSRFGHVLDRGARRLPLLLCQSGRRVGASRRLFDTPPKKDARPLLCEICRTRGSGLATFCDAGRGARRSCFAKSSVARMPRGVFFDTPKKRRPAIALRNMSHSQIGVQNTSPFVFGRSTRNRPKSHL